MLAESLILSAKRLSQELARLSIIISCSRPVEIKYFPIMAERYYPAELIEKVQRLIDVDAATVGPVTAFAHVMGALKAANIPYVADEVSPQHVLVHPDNRGKLGLNPFNVHRNGAFIKRVGADRTQLTQATAFELSPMEPKRSQQLKMNSDLISRSAGLLAPLNGSERLLSVGCGHTVAFCRAALVSCPTPQASIADASGCLNVQMLTKLDPEFKIMLEKGWSWTVLPWQVEEVWPRLPDLAQRALNASNSVASQTSELETASTIAELAAMQSAAGQPLDWESCIAAAGSSMPACLPYIATIGKYVRLYGGGDQAPMIKYLDMFAKVWGENRRLGEEFFKIVTDTQFSAAKMCPNTCCTCVVQIRGCINRNVLLLDACIFVDELVHTRAPSAIYVHAVSYTRAPSATCIVYSHVYT